MNNIIKVKNLRKVYRVPKKQNWIKSMFWPNYDKLCAVNDISFEINKGESVALLGPNGAGKTTTLKMLTGLMLPTSGEIKIMGFVPFERNFKFLHKIALVMGNKSGLSWDLSANQSFSLLKTIYGLTDRESDSSISNLADIMEVNDCLDRPIRKLSLGQRLKMELIAAIIHSPDILFLDEPTIGLDVVAKKNIRDFLKKVNKEQDSTIILTSHDMDDIENVCERVIVINHGAIMFDGSIEKLLNNYRDKKYITFIFKEPILEKKLKSYGKIIDRKILSYKFEIPAGDQSKVIAQITEKFPVDDIDITHVPLDEIMTDMFKTSPATGGTAAAGRTAAESSTTTSKSPTATFKPAAT
jgi:ABC-2 type transport system ATP-binding protein